MTLDGDHSELGRLAALARQLPRDVPPPRDLWAGIAARLEPRGQLDHLAASLPTRVDPPEGLWPKIEARIAPAVGLLLPGERLDVVAFGCTSASMVIGETRVFARIREARPDIACTTPITAALAALKALDVRRVALLTPYVRTINDFMRDYIEARGVAVTRMASFEHADDNEVARIDANSIRSAIETLARHDDADAVFVSCTSLRVAALVPELEAAIGKPVLSSNHAMAWHALRLAGVQDSEPQLGRLFAR